LNWPVSLVVAAGDPQFFLALAVSFVVAIALHEAAHAFVASWLGDATPRFQGRRTLNPISHLDVFGTLALAVLGLGWGKPVPVNPTNLRGGPLRGMAIVALSGPTANLLTAVLIAVLVRAGLLDGLQWPFGLVLLQTLFTASIFLTVFNLFPVPPLDGFTLLLAILDRDTAYRIRAVNRQITMTFFGVLLLAYFVRIDLLGAVTRPPAEFAARLVLGV
jgi:Zn-dependent protease